MGRRIRRTNRRSNLRKARKSMKRRNTLKRTSMKRKTMKRKTMKRKTMKRRNNRRNFRKMRGGAPAYSNWGHTLKTKLTELSGEAKWVDMKEDGILSVNLGDGKSVDINFEFGDTPPSEGGAEAESTIESANAIQIDSCVNLPKLNHTFLEKCNMLKDNDPLHKDKVAVIFADPGKNDVDDLPATLALIKNFGEVLLFDCSGKNEYTTPIYPCHNAVLTKFATANGCKLVVIDDHKHNGTLSNVIESRLQAATLAPTALLSLHEHIECFLLCPFSDDKTKSFINDYLSDYVLSRPPGSIFNFNIYGDVNPDIQMGDPIAYLKLNKELDSVERLMDFLLNSTLQTHNIGSNLRMSAKYYAVNAPNEEGGRPARNYDAWESKGRPGYKLDIVAQNPNELVKYYDNRANMHAIIEASSGSKNYDYDKTQRFETNYPEVDVHTGLGLNGMLKSGAFTNTANKYKNVVSGKDKKDLADLSFVLSFLYGGD